MPTRLNIASAHCWAPEADGADRWRSWLNHASLPSGDTPPPLSHIKPMQRRRLSLLARAAFEVGARCLDELDEDAQAGVACLFANAYGQCEATVKMLESLAAGEPTSPAAFSLSVHNAIAGQFSIAHTLTASSSTLAPGRDGLGGVFLEAAGWLAEGRCEHLLVCCFEAPVPETLKPHEINPPTPMAAAFMLQRNPDTSSTVTLELQRSVDELTPLGSPFWQQLLEFVVFLDNCQAEPHAQQALTIESGGVTYSWQTR